jgi:serine/threonine protein kinase
MASPLLNSEKNYDKEYIDAGNFGSVFKITLHSNKNVYALKQLDFSKLNKRDIPSAKSDAINEYKIMRLDIPNVLKSYGSYFDEANNIFRFSTEMMETNLRKYIQKNGAMSFEKFQTIFGDILTGETFFLFISNIIKIILPKKKQVFMDSINNQNLLFIETSSLIIFY